MEEGKERQPAVCSLAQRSDLPARMPSLTGWTCPRHRVSISALPPNSATWSFAQKWQGRWLYVISRDDSSSAGSLLAQQRQGRRAVCKQFTVSRMVMVGDQLRLFPKTYSVNTWGRFVLHACHWVYSKTLKRSQNNL